MPQINDGLNGPIVTVAVVKIVVNILKPVEEDLTGRGHELASLLLV